MRYLGLDLGTRTLGISISDITATIANSYKTIRFNEGDYEVLIPELRNIIEEYNIGKIVLGFPKNMNNTIGERAEACKEFAARLEQRTGIEVVMWDERLSTVSANNVLIESGVRREQRKAVIDKIAAVFILQGYLDYLANQSKEEWLKTIKSMFCKNFIVIN